MNKHVFIIIMILCGCLSAQNNSDFYPLHIGNKWKYIHLSYEAGTIPDTSYIIKEVVGDTLMPNGIKYFIVKEDNRIHYERYDTLTNEIKYYQNGGCGGIDDTKYKLVYNRDSVIVWKQCDVAPCFITYDDTTYGVDSALIVLDMDYLVTTHTEFRKNLGIYLQTASEIGYYVTALQGAVINGNRWGVITSVEDDEIITKFNLYQNFPNPFNPVTKIIYSVYEKALVTIKIYDILGNELSTLVDDIKYPGEYTIEFDGGNLSSGVYLCKMSANNFIATRKLLLIK
ncbi:T9SS type A sorting domain-containing protein [Melioribacter sp. Ez-97]|uniref:T9SS type A sorting domain-containing protein n=1 Tax=Melioribacter sp. Ez-97 TaxID=3423434 RepID=UPI003EDB0337